MRKAELVAKGRALPYITNEGGSIRTYLQRLELNINGSVRKYYNRSDYLTGSRSNSNHEKHFRYLEYSLGSIFDIVAPDSCSRLFYCYTHLQDFRLV